MMRCATLMPSPMMFGWPLMSFTSFTGPRLMPMRTGLAARSRLVAACLAHHRLAQAKRHEERVFRIAEEADGRAIARVEDDPVR
jgi:hypothetical protein